MDDFNFNDNVWVKTGNGDEVVKGKVVDRFQGNQWIVDIQNKSDEWYGQLVSAEDMTKIHST